MVLLPFIRAREDEHCSNMIRIHSMFMLSLFGSGNVPHNEEVFHIEDRDIRILNTEPFSRMQVLTLLNSMCFSPSNCSIIAKTMMSFLSSAVDECTSDKEEELAAFIISAVLSE